MTKFKNPAQYILNYILNKYENNQKLIKTDVNFLDFYTTTSKINFLNILYLYV